MATAKNTQKNFLKFGFTTITHNGIDKPQCVLCLEVLAPSSFKPSKIKDI